MLKDRQRVHSAKRVMAVHGTAPLTPVGLDKTSLRSSLLVLNELHGRMHPMFVPQEGILAITLPCRPTFVATDR
jgi:hypothetical protein